MTTALCGARLFAFAESIFKYPLLIQSIVRFEQSENPAAGENFMAKAASRSTIAAIRRMLGLPVAIKVYSLIKLPEFPFQNPWRRARSMMASSFWGSSWSRQLPLGLPDQKGDAKLGTSGERLARSACAHMYAESLCQCVEG